jgi:hypothetical protein
MALNRQQTAKQAAEVHRMNLRRNVEQRLEAARASGNEQLVHALEQEASYVK